jgi:hypothetical protein
MKILAMRNKFRQVPLNEGEKFAITQLVPAG